MDLFFTQWVWTMTSSRQTLNQTVLRAVLERVGRAKGSRVDPLPPERAHTVLTAGSVRHALRVELAGVWVCGCVGALTT